jgi:glucose dehydrogenase
VRYCFVQLELNKADRSRHWLYGDDDYRGQRYELDQINAESVPGLALACTYAFPKSEGSETASIVYDGTLYAATAHCAGALNCR